MMRGWCPPYKEGELDCGTCRAKTRLGRRCNKIYPKPLKWPQEQYDSYLKARADILDEETVCPVLRVEQGPAWVVGTLSDARMVERGILRRAGGIDDQPSKWWRAVKIVLSELGAIESEKAAARAAG